MTGMFRVCAVVVSVALLAAAVVSVPERAEALSASEFDPGYIISDEQFYASGAMSQDEIQRFLDAQIGTCQNSLCLNVLRVDTPTTTLNFGTCATYAGEVGESAARIIYKVQQACVISAKVILTTLQKEQGLVTSKAPTSTVLRKAMGQGCPDTAQCDSAFYGFFIQVLSGARQLAWYGNPNGSHTSIKVGQYNAVRFSPNPDCGSSSVFINNRATAALYYYTPYQPNAAALANLGGIGDACSAYGNRNFWVYYNNWFGASSDSAGTVAIQQVYAAQGGASGPLGGVASVIMEIADNGGGLGQAFVNGSIYWTGRSGARVVTGSMRTYYFAQGGAGGSLAWPTSEAGAISQNGGGSGQAFQRGSVYSSPTTGTQRVMDPIRGAYFRFNGAAGLLGWPTSEPLTVSENRGGTGQAFQGGSVFSSAHGAWATWGEIRDRYFSLGGAAGTLSWPASGIAAIPQHGGGTGQAFAAGSIFSSSRGTWAVAGQIRDHYFTLGGAAGSLGWPTNAAVCGQSDGSCTQAFQYGSIIWSPSAGVRVGSPEMEAAYATLGGTAGAFGSVTSGLLPISQNGSGLGQTYQGGSIYWKASTGAYGVSGPIRARYFSGGGAAGALGWPTAAGVCGQTDGECSQKFERGMIVWSLAAGASLGLESIENLYATLGGATGELGDRASGLISISQNGGGTGQVFEAGSIYSSAAGTWAVTGEIRGLYFAWQGAAGALGWPSAAPVCGLADGGCTQAFQHGTIVWSPTAGASVQ